MLLPAPVIGLGLWAWSRSGLKARVTGALRRGSPDLKPYRSELCCARTGRGCQTPQVPPNPIVTRSSSTITGTARRPLLYPSMRCRSAGFFLTLMYSNGTCRPS